MSLPLADLSRGLTALASVQWGDLQAALAARFMNLQADITLADDIVEDIEPLLGPLGPELDFGLKALGFLVSIAPTITITPAAPYEAGPGVYRGR